MPAQCTSILLLNAIFWRMLVRVLYKCYVPPSIGGLSFPHPMRHLSTGLVAIILLISPLADAATAVPRLEPTGDIIVNGRDIEWNATPNPGYAFAAEQAEYRAWMREEYRSWKSQWKEPLDQERFAALNRRARQILAASHRRAVRTGNWNFRPRLVTAGETSSETATAHKERSRPSRRSIIQAAEERNAVKVPAAVGLMRM